MAALDPELLQYASPEERKAYQDALEAQTALLSPSDYMERVNPDFKRFAHTELLNQLIVAHTNHAVYASGIGLPAVWVRDPDEPEDTPEEEQNGWWLHPETGEQAVDICVVSLPPQHGKSHIITETAAGWFLSRNPDKNVILTAYEADFARTFSVKNQNKVRDARIPGIELDPRRSSGAHWGLKGHVGECISAGAGGAITGKGGHLIIVDDPIKNAEEALSETLRDKMWNWWLSTVKSRKRKGTVYFVIQTRWHEDDLAGRISRKERCYTLNIPALAFDGNPDEDGVARDPETGERDPLGRRPGQALCPALHTKASLEEVRERGDDTEDGLGGALWFSCLYQGKPRMMGAGILPGPFLRYTASGANQRQVYTLTTKNGTEKTVPGDMIRRFITADLAASTRTRADWTVFSLWGWTPDGDLLLLDMHRSRMESPDHTDKAVDFWNTCRDTFGKVSFFGVENKTFGMSLIQALQREPGVLVRPLEADADKVTRALSAAGPMLMAGRVYFPRTPWAEEFIQECEGFDTAAHDDMVDTLAYAALEARKLPKVRTPQTQQPRNMNTRAQGRIDSLMGRGKRRKEHPILGR